MHATPNLLFQAPFFYPVCILMLTIVIGNHVVIDKGQPRRCHVAGNVGKGTARADSTLLQDQAVRLLARFLHAKEAVKSSVVHSIPTARRLPLDRTHGLATLTLWPLFGHQRGQSNGSGRRSCSGCCHCWRKSMKPASSASEGACRARTALLKHQLESLRASLRLPFKDVRDCEVDASLAGGSKALVGARGFATQRSCGGDRYGCLCIGHCGDRCGGLCGGHCCGCCGGHRGGKCGGRCGGRCDGCVSWAREPLPLATPYFMVP
mmetsp:Transcript_20614/g.43866  ORF Transcript_20614/g.43866 Transcript_20614/m.43866 type:complete len:264 (-) Transcript_20614:375-1166(-)